MRQGIAWSRQRPHKDRRGAAAGHGHRAPAPGVILRKNVELGETVAAGTPIFTIGDLSSPWIKVYVPEPQLTLVKLGQQAKVTLDTEPNRPKKYDGWVSYISNGGRVYPEERADPGGEGEARLSVSRCVWRTRTRTLSPVCRRT